MTEFVNYSLNLIALAWAISILMILVLVLDHATSPKGRRSILDDIRDIKVEGPKH